MKRQILKSLSTLCVSAMALFATSSLVVSCYDDGALWDAVEDVQGDVDELSKTIAEVQAKLEALTSRVDALYTLKFQVTTENELQYSFDGGTTWVSTGIDLAEECACPEVSLVDNGDTVTISVGEQSYTIEKPEVVKFEIVSGKQFFDYDETKSVVISASGIQSVFVAKYTPLSKMVVFLFIIPFSRSLSHLAPKKLGKCSLYSEEPGSLLNLRDLCY